ncbi:MAG: carbohydrate kinase family protein [Meiothermus sp.]|nr:carbohydrate kinase family protein [Meiothermus sp.]
MTKHLLVSGLVNLETTLKVDRFPLVYEPVRFPFFGVGSRVAGVGFNLSKALVTLGSRVELLSLTGRDEVGLLAHKAVVELGLSTAYLLPELEAQPQSVILYEPGGRRMIFSDLKDIQDRTYPAGRFEAALENAALAVLCNINFSRALLPVAKAGGVPVATDVHTIGSLEDAYNDDFMAAADVLFQSHEKLPVTPEEWVGQVSRRYGKKLMVVGLGAEGALLWDGGRAVRVPAVQPRPAVNTVGAGDALFAAFLHFYAKGLEPYGCLRRAVWFAGYKVGASGAAEGFLGEEDLERLAARPQTG